MLTNERNVRGGLLLDMSIDTKTISGTRRRKNEEGEMEDPTSDETRSGNGSRTIDVRRDEAARRADSRRTMLERRHHGKGGLRRIEEEEGEREEEEM